MLVLPVIIISKSPVRAAADSVSCEDLKMGVTKRHPTFLFGFVGLNKHGYLIIPLKASTAVGAIIIPNIEWICI